LELTTGNWHNLTSYNERGTRYGVSDMESSLYGKQV
jgi:hypothetical protein